MLESFEVRLAGARHRPIEMQVIVQRLTVGTRLTLKRQPDNEYDENAVQVYQDEDFIGFIPKKRAAEIAPMMDAGAEFTCTVTSDNGLDPFLKVEEIPADEDEEDDSDDGPDTD